MSDVRIVERPRRDQLGEGPLWHAPESALYWVDILEQRVNRLSLSDDRIDEWPMPEMVGWVIARRDAPERRLQLVEALPDGVDLALVTGKIKQRRRIASR